MPHKLRKIRKFRGTRTIGYGRIGQHRDSGSKGNRKVGRHKHLWSKVVTSDPGYFGKHGFTSPQSKHRIESTINLLKLDQLSTGKEINLTDTRLHKTPRHRQNHQSTHSNRCSSLKIRPDQDRSSRRKTQSSPQPKQKQPRSKAAKWPEDSSAYSNP